MIDLSDETIGRTKIKVSADAEVEIDVFKTQNLIAAEAAKFKNRPQHEFDEAVVELLVGLGLPRVSHCQSVRFRDALAEEVKRLGGFMDGSGETMPESRDSTD